MANKDSMYARPKAGVVAKKPITGGAAPALPGKKVMTGGPMKPAKSVVRPAIAGQKFNPGAVMSKLGQRKK